MFLLPSHHKIMPTLMPGPVTRNKSSQANHKRPGQYSSGRNTKKHHPPQNQDLHTPEYWDRLSRIPLVRKALRELDRRNDTLEPLVEDSESQLSYSSLKQFARHGGPDLSDIRGHKPPPTPPPINYQSQNYPQTRMRGRRTQRVSGGTSKPILGKRGRDRSDELAEQEGHRESGRRSTGRRHTRRTQSVSEEPRATAVMSRATENEISTQSMTSTTSKSGPYKADFGTHLKEHNVLPLNDDEVEPPEPPDNMQDIRLAMKRERTWTPDFEIKAQAFRAGLRGAKNERDILNLLNLECIPGQTTNITRSSIISRDQSWSALHPLTDATITVGKPDLAYATRLTKLRRPIRDELGAMIVPTTSREFVCPNFMVAVKGPRGTQAVNDVQAVHVGALAARGMHALWTYGNSTEAVDAERDTSKIARTITCTWLAGTFTMYATYRQDPQGADDESECSTSTSSALPKYCTSLIGAWVFNTVDDEELKKGFAAYLNGLEWAQRQRDEAIKRANKRYKAIKHAKQVASDEKREREQRRSREIEYTEDQIQGTACRGSQIDKSPSVDGLSEDTDSLPGDRHDSQQVTWSFNSADSGATITQTRSQAARTG
ncbi:hypothetical protein N0V93_002292 [Gnomoniopsis smithogilvyi]|uniref:Uncharacterized protein n=1 Tax=Gnomoniopsis smithogilvyi TaxID=1191159 RepID=A0A9W9CXJ3_9PEZI|nr:hypothetical protein N0V93_002292 [Gnomoniopsis smithogilvyi]